MYTVLLPQFLCPLNDFFMVNLIFCDTANIELLMYSFPLHCRSRLHSLLSHVWLKNTMGKECIVVGCCNKDTDKQLVLKFHRLAKEETRRVIEWLKTKWKRRKHIS